jgi:very-short-patch-repair endonuclease
MRNSPFEKGGQGDLMLKYRSDLKITARRLRKEATDAERVLWSKLRRKQILGVRFYRQKPIGDFIVDFYAPRVRLVVEVDGPQHREETRRQYDEQRTRYLEALELRVLRFQNGDVLHRQADVVGKIRAAAASSKIPPGPPSSKGGD